jgi:hypothetical protein
VEKQGGMVFGFRKTATSVIKPERERDFAMSQFTPRSSKWSLSFSFFPTKIMYSFSCLPHTCHVTCPTISF